MARPTAPIHICNLALDELKQNPINSLTTPVTNAEFACLRWYDATRLECLAQHPWKFATKRDILTPDPTATPPFGYTYAYNLPSDWVRLVTIGDDYLNDLKREFEIENNQILTPTGTSATDTLSLQIRYIFDQDDVTTFSPLFIKYFYLQLALNMATKFSTSSTIRASIRDEFKDIEMQAKAVNGQDRRPKRIQFSRTLTKRRGLPGGVWASKYTIFDS
jgi:hypothetical protein